ncbi:MAG: single-stranded-DNA-specific exonuclease RecJ [Acetobacteraceae bacterium]|nr:single-stranded-DNA-specific exonuclease RecJ [Acetobacteraceae bacterium]
MAQRLGLPEMVGRLLARRGIDPELAEHFLAPTLRALMPDPSTLAGMDAAADRLAHAIRSGETVAVFGDYDVDGACSAAIVTLFVRQFGGRVLTHVPDRLREGYGPNAPALLSLVEQGAGLIVCVDCGTAAGPALAAVAGLADVVVLDHHATDGPPPPVLATVNPNRLDCRSGLGNCCAAAIVFLTAIATVRNLRRAGFFANRPEPDLRELLDLVALATVCDVMPLHGLNRAFVTQGLRVMARRARPGIAALLEAASANGLPTAMTCGFALGPRINAAGRISDSSLGLRLLLTDDPVEARALAAQLDSTNRDRQVVEAAIMDDAIAQAEAQARAGRAAVLIAGEGWHAGVVGIVAGRLKERLNRPVCVAAVTDGVAKGSGRSVAGVDLGQAVMAARQAGLLSAGGGHPMAAGFALPASGLAAFHEFLDTRLAHAATLPQQADLAVEGSIAVGGATIELAQHLNRLSPFGNGNEEPALVVQRAVVTRAERIGREAGTIRAWLAGEDGARLKALMFRAADGPIETALLSRQGPLHVAGHLRAEEWNGTVTASFFIADAASA